MKLLVIDNFDSFTYNLVQYLGEMGVSLHVYRNNAITLDQIRALEPNGIIISPGPGTPDRAGITLDCIREFAGKIPILGVCLGHQAIGKAFGASIVRAPELMHGKISRIFHDGNGIYAGLPNPFLATRYHSLIVDEETLPPVLRVTARSEKGLIMGLEHETHPVVGVQFHPESFLTDTGKLLLENFLRQYVHTPKPVSVPSQPPTAREADDMLQKAVQKAVAGEHLTREEARRAMDVIMSGKATPAQIGAFLVALRMKGERAEEIAGFAESMRAKATPVQTRHERVIDLCGTGGDGKNTFNISTVASFVVAGAGVPVAKHGNRSVSSKSGSADVLKALGVKIDLSPEAMGRCLDEVGMAFLFAPRLHGAMKHAIGPRREIGVRTVFNILGPITNPAGVRRQLIGVFSPQLLRLLAEVLQQLDAEHVMLVHSADGLDEISLAAGTKVVELRSGQIREFELQPSDFGLFSVTDGMQGGDAETNARIALDILNGKKGPATDVVVANAAAGLYVAGAADSLKACAEMAMEAIASGAALKKLEHLREFTNRIED